MEWLKELLLKVEGLEDSQVSQIIDSVKAEFPKHAVPKEQYSKKTNELEETQNKLDEASAKMQELASASDSIEELKLKLQEKTDELTQFKSDIDKREVTRNKTQALTSALANAGAVKSSIDLLINTFDLDSIQLDKKGNIVDLDELITPVKESRAELFAQTKPNDNPPPKNENVEDDDMDDQAYFNKKMKKE